MSLVLVILTICAGLFVGWNIGANDSANCIGPTLGAGLIRYRSGIALVAFFAFLGAMLQGQGVVETVGSGIVDQPLPMVAVLVALLTGAFFVAIATFRKIPVSTSQAVVGAVSGIGLAAGFSVETSNLITIVECWILCPVMSAGLAYAILRLTRFVMKRVKRQQSAQRFLAGMILFASCYSAYFLGANHLGNAIGPIAPLDIMPALLLSLLGAASISVGALTFGRGVAETVGRSITRLDITAAFAAQISAAFGVHLFTIIGVPVSTSQAIVGAVMGVGLVHGIRTVSRRKIGEIVVGWVSTPLVSGCTAFGLYWVVLRLGG